MKHFKHFALTVLVALVSSLSASAYDFEVDGIYYNRTEGGVSVTKEGLNYNYNYYKGNIVIPAEVEIGKSSYAYFDIQSGTWTSNNTSEEYVYTCSSPGSNGSTIIRCTFMSDEPLVFTCVSNGESNYDYLTIGEIDTPCTRSSYKYSLKGKKGQEETFTFEANDGNQHYIEFCYSKDGSVDTSPDNATIKLKKFSNTIVTKYPVVAIEDYVFYGCYDLTSVSIPGSVTSIGMGAFQSSGLTSINIPNSVTSIGIYAFKGSHLTSITIPSSIVTIEDNAFAYCQDLTSIELPNSIKSIEDYAFEGCRNLTEITIPSSVQTIGRSAFGLSNTLKRVYFNAARCTVMGDSQYPVFDKCNALSEVVFGEDVEIIPDYAFYNCSGISSLDLPNNLTSIGNYAFYNCSGIASLDLPNNIKTIGERAFYNNSLKLLILPPNLESIGEYAFSGSEWKKVANLSSYEIPYNSYGWVRVLINNAVIDGDFVYSDESKTSLGLYIGNASEVVVPSQVVSIGEYAFYDTPSLKVLTIPENIVSIGNSAFSQCSNLERVNFNAVRCLEVVDGERYGQAAFQYCYSLKEVVFGDNVEVIPEKAFYCCGLESVMIPRNITSIGRDAFGNCSNLTTVNFNAENCLQEGIYNTPFSNCSSLSNVVFGETVKSIPDYIFYNCSGITSVDIPDNVETIGYDAFHRCSGLITLNLGNNIKSIGSGAFASCSSLTSVTIPESVTSVGETAFGYCI